MIYLLSCRGLVSSVSYDSLFELEDLMVSLLQGTLIIPTLKKELKFLINSIDSKTKKVFNKTFGLYNIEQFPISQTETPNILFMIDVAGSCFELLSSIKNWRKKFDIVVAYISDSWLLLKYQKKYLELIDYLFVPQPEVREDIERGLGKKVFLLPFACDTLAHGSADLNRFIDVINFGRNNPDYHKILSEKFARESESNRFYYDVIARANQKYPEIVSYRERIDYQYRKQLFYLLRHSKLALLFDNPYTKQKRKIPYSYLTVRWFEASASGCAIVGKRPTTSLYNELFPWENATIELPDDPQEGIEFIENLLEDESRLHTMHKRNYLENLIRNDWRHRIKYMLEVINIPLPNSLVQDLDKLQRIYSEGI
ncbi:MAG: glycosyltransferase family 1 protein [Gloeocapsa sp. DLM2.Bin57]|nr:MAG: glycosyltransferase family 1 protein [Gloeocapsa sp. DLM2.Bin57]